MSDVLYRKLSTFYPDLGLKLRQARMPDTEHYYLQRTVMVAFFSSLGISFIVFFFIPNLGALLCIPIFFPLFFLYFMKYVDMQILKLSREVSAEIVYAIRFLIIEFDSGVSVYNSLKNVTHNYPAIGRYANEIVQKLDLGIPLNEAMNEAVEYCPSPELKKVFWQMMTSIKIGSELTGVLTTVVDQIIREQKIEVTEYGRKLNPMAMFYMMMAIIVPSLGTTMVVVMASFLGLKIPFFILVIIAGLVAFMQFMFYSIIKSQRPAVGF